METSTLKPNLMVLKASLPMWTNEEIEMEIQELKHWINDLQLVNKDTSYFENKKEILENTLKARQ